MRKHDSSYPVRVKGLSVDVHDDFTKAFRIFNKKVQDSDKLRDVRENRHHETKTETRQKDLKQAKKRLKKKLEAFEKEGGRRPKQW